MKIWYGTIIVATVILIGYLVIVIGRHLPNLSANAEEAQTSFKLLQERLDKQTELLTSMQADIKKLGKDSNQPTKPPPEDKGKLAVDSLRASLAKLTEADVKKQQGDMNSAIDLLKSVKEAIWKAGDNLTSHQAALRALMGPIDIIMTQWKQGDKKVDTSKIAVAVRTVLQKIDNAFNP
jgi:chromosome segregation ATPase